MSFPSGTSEFFQSSSTSTSYINEANNLMDDEEKEIEQKQQVSVPIAYPVDRTTRSQTMAKKNHTFYSPSTAALSSSYFDTSSSSSSTSSSSSSSPSSFSAEAPLPLNTNPSSSTSLQFLLDLGFSSRECSYALHLYPDSLDSAALFLAEMNEEQSEELQWRVNEWEQRKQLVKMKEVEKLELEKKREQDEKRDEQKQSQLRQQYLTETTSDNTFNSNNHLVSNNGISGGWLGKLFPRLFSNALACTEFLSPNLSNQPEPLILSKIPNFPILPTPPTPPDSFTCTTCTYFNDNISNRCEMCNSERELNEEEQMYTASLRECQICFEQIPLSCMFTAGASCNHTYCYPCMYQCFKNRIEEGKVLGLTCPALGCPRLISDIDMKNLLDPYSYDRYLRFRRNAELSRDPRVRFCPNRQCQHINYGDSSRPCIRCQHCGLKFCFNCRVSWHEGLSCSDLMRLGDSSTGPTNDDVSFLHLMSNGIGSRYRQCRQCGAWVEKTSGCDKFTCRCGFQFCFRCGTTNAVCHCTPGFHVFYSHDTVMSNWNNRGPG